MTNKELIELLKTYPGNTPVYIGQGWNPYHGGTCADDLRIQCAPNWLILEPVGNSIDISFNLADALTDENSALTLLQSL